MFVVAIRATLLPFLLPASFVLKSKEKKSPARPKQHSLSLLSSKPKLKYQNGRREIQQRASYKILLSSNKVKALVLVLATSFLIFLPNSQCQRTNLTSPLSPFLPTVLLDQVYIVPQISKWFLSVLSIVISLLFHEVLLTPPIQDPLDLIFLFVLEVKCFLQRCLVIRQFQ